MTSALKVEREYKYEMNDEYHNKILILPDLVKPHIQYIFRTYYEVTLGIPELKLSAHSINTHGSATELKIDDFYCDMFIQIVVCVEGKCCIKNGILYCQFDENTVTCRKNGCDTIVYIYNFINEEHENIFIKTIRGYEKFVLYHIELHDQNIKIVGNHDKYNIYI